VRNELINLELARQVIIYKSRELRAALDTAKGATLPASAGDKLKG